MSLGNIDERDLRRVVEEVIMRLKLNKNSDNLMVDVQPPKADFLADGNNGIFSSVDSAFEAANLAFKALKRLSLKKRSEIIENFRSICRKEAENLAKMAVEETGLGRVEDKIKKNMLAIDKTPGVEDVKPHVYTGDYGLTLQEFTPYGVLAAITPSTNPAATVINNSISMVAAGNTVVFNNHPSAKNVSLRVIELFNKASVAVGGPPNLVTGIAEPTIETSKAVMNHKLAKVVVVTGGGGVVKAAFETGKKVMAAGPGNPPVVVDDTADIEKAGHDIVNGASFDNNVLCIAEKEIIAVDCVVDRLKEVMIRNGAYEISKDELLRLEKVIFTPEGKPNKKFVGKNANVILKEIGINVDVNTRLIICETEPKHPLVFTEMLMPVIPIVRMPDVDSAIDLAEEVENGNLHTIIMHSKDVGNLHKFAVRVQASIFVKNGPSYAGLGFEGEGPTTLTICTPTGEGITTAKTFTRMRRCVLKDYFRII